MIEYNIDIAKIASIIKCSCYDGEAYVRECIKQMIKNDVLKQHSYKITQGKDGYWRTYVKDSNKPSGCRLIKKSTKKKLLDDLVNHYKKVNDKLTFKDMYSQWRTVQDRLVEDNTVYKYKTDYIRFLSGSKFENYLLEDITEDKIKLFFHDSIKKNNLTKGAFKKLFGYVQNTFDKAYREKIITDNPMLYITCKQFYTYCREVDKPLNKQIFSPEEERLILDKLHDGMRKRPDYIPNYAVEFASLTGMRVGEIVALKWENICWNEGYFIINASEKYDRLTKEYYIDTTKNKKVRKFPIDTTIESFLYNMTDIQYQFGIESDWIFANVNGRIHASVVSSCIKNKCKQLGIPPRGIHAFRKTFNSNMRCSGVSEVVAATLLGHSPQVNRDYYTFDTSSMKEKLAIISNVHACRV